MVGGTEARNRRQVFRTAVAAVPVPAISLVPAGQPAHESIPDRLGDDARGRDGVAIGVAVHEGVVGMPDFGHGEAVQQEAGPRGRGAAGQDAEDGAAHREGGRDADVELIDLADGRPADADGEGRAADLEREGLPPNR